MDKLSEPEFESDLNWPRIKQGVEEYIKASETKKNAYFAFFSAASIYRYYREINFYVKNNSFFYFLIIPTFAFSSYQLATYLTYDPYAIAALKNNEMEKQYIEGLKKVWNEAKNKNIELPDRLIK